MEKLKNKKVWMIGISLIFIAVILFIAVQVIYAATINGTKASNGSQRLVMTYSITGKTASSATVDWNLYAQKLDANYSTYNNNVTVSMTIGGTKKTYSGKTYSIKGLSVNGKKLICSGSQKVTRTNGAAKTVKVSASVPTGSTTVGTLKLSGSIAIPYFEVLKTVSGSIAWSDDGNRDGKRPSTATVTLYRSGTNVASKSTASSFSFTGQPTYNTSGSAYSYTINGSAITGYTKAVSGTKITYTHVPEKVSIAGKIIWEDQDDQAEKRPSSVTVSLKNGSTVVATKTVTAANNWAYSFDNQYKYASGKQITYTVTQGAVSKYTTSVSGYNITNTLNTDFDYRIGFSL